MLSVLRSIAITSFALILCACGSETQDKPSVSADTSLVKQPAMSFETAEQKVSYTLAYREAKRLQESGITLNIEAYQAGLQAALSGQASILSEAAVAGAFNEVQAQAINQQQIAQKALATKNAQEGQAFLEANAKKPGVVQTASGLQYLVLEPAGGSSPKPDNNVTYHYELSLLDGTVIDSSYARQFPVTQMASQNIAGVVEALQLMPTGAVWQLTIPALLAYGEEGLGRSIPPNATLLYKIELLSISNS